MTSPSLSKGFLSPLSEHHSYSNASLVSVREIHVYTVIYGISTMRQWRKANWLCGYHRPQNEQHKINQTLYHSFQPIISLARTVVVTAETLHLQCSYTEAQSLNTDDEKQAPKDCHGNRAFQHHHHHHHHHLHHSLFHLMGCTVELKVCWKISNSLENMF